MSIILCNHSGGQRPDRGQSPRHFSCTNTKSTNAKFCEAAQSLLSGGQSPGLVPLVTTEDSLNGYHFVLNRTHFLGQTQNRYIPVNTGSIITFSTRNKQIFRQTFSTSATHCISLIHSHYCLILCLCKHSGGWISAITTEALPKKIWLRMV